jgi:hypothetical protein
MDSLIVGILAGAIGTGYFVYGKRQTRIAPMIAGALLCVYPYFVDGALWLILIGAILMALPFFLDY